MGTGVALQVARTPGMEVVFLSDLSKEALSRAVQATGLTAIPIESSSSLPQRGAGEVYVVAECTDPLQAFYLYSYNVSSQGSFHLFFRPYHLCHLETPRAIAQAFLDQRRKSHPSHRRQNGPPHPVQRGRHTRDQSIPPAPAASQLAAPSPLTAARPSPSGSRSRSGAALWTGPDQAAPIRPRPGPGRACRASHRFMISLTT